ncbi:MAG: D-glycero-beta-D-manno-heptose 1-phosphate adenylyltransferase [Pseudanabaenaceae cyanobacterium SKYGB_i_bin29]|nr:D-glycero-beta-D-manno-heptose 1-phosphate adenylyltransferase [Pseudanabaenaceae cyanobacterium SKYG29]MDW8422339.1 D-glycero-beta-D-manno-heptose 1-phosphate adenylyltransferase [Pseudanabaenaceae cyanobacterium SKYGB_i_bin29]
MIEALQQDINNHPDRWRPLVLTNGCFDILHAGHVRYLTQARALGRALVVGLNSDHSVRQLKGNTRPIVPQAQRAEVLLGLKAVDAVVIFEELTADRLITALRPDIYVKGGDYTPDTLPEAPTVAATGGKIVIIPIEIQTSTSHILRRILTMI